MVLDLCQAVVLITLDDRFANALLEKGSVREDELAAFELGRVGWEEVFHEPLEFLTADDVLILLNEGLNWVDNAPELQLCFVSFLNPKQCLLIVEELWL